MNDDFRVRFPSNYAVHSSTTKRDHVTDNAAKSVPGRDHEHHKHARRDSMEFSVDAADDD
ncbi:MAG: hypothetical protein HQ592_14065, partial [Planctomycetes bacterium]|nr:hypothetical protein [Planctomycetota bacterium]